MELLVNLKKKLAQLHFQGCPFLCRCSECGLSRGIIMLEINIGSHVLFRDIFVPSASIHYTESISLRLTMSFNVYGILSCSAVKTAR